MHEISWSSGICLYQKFKIFERDIEGIQNYDEIS